MASQHAETYMPDEPCTHGHFSPRFVSTRRCVACERIYYQKRYQEQKAKRALKEKVVKEANTYMPTERCVNGHLAPRYIATRSCTVCAKEADKKWHAKNVKARRMEKDDPMRTEPSFTKEELLQAAGLIKQALPSALLSPPEVTPKQYTKYMQLMIFKTTVATELMYFASLGGYDMGRLAQNIIRAFDFEDTWWEGKQGMVLGEMIHEFLKDQPVFERTTYRSDAANTTFVLERGPK